MGFFNFLKSMVVKPPKSEGELLSEEVVHEYALSLHEKEALREEGQKTEKKIEEKTQISSESDLTSKKEIIEEIPEEKEVLLDPIPSQMAPFMVEMIKGRQYKLCTCGQSEKHPFCDHSHEAEGCKHKPYIYKPKRSGYHSICGCMESYDYPICDGTHDLLL